MNTSVISRAHDDSEYRSIFDAVNDAVFVHDPQSGAILHVNEKMREMYGISGEEARTLTIEDISGGEPAFGSAQAQERLALAAAGTPQRFEWLARHRDGHVFWVEVSLRRIVVDGTVRLLAVARDISEQKRTRQAIAHERDFVETVLDTAASLIVVLDREGRIVRFNRACTEVSGYTFDEVRGTSIWALVPPDEREDIEQPWRALLVGGRRVTHENHWVSKSGERRLIAWSNNTVFGENGEVEYVIATGVDVTEERETHTALRESEERYRRLVETANEGIWSLDTDDRITFANRRLTDITGYPPQELIGLSVLELVDAPSRPIVAAALQQRRLGGANHYEVQVRRKDGTTVWVLVSGSPVVDNEGRYIGALGLTTDISGHKDAEEALRRAHDELERDVAERTRELMEANEALRVNAAALQAHERELAQRASTLHDTLVERDRLLRDLDAERQMLQTLIDHMPEGVLVAEGPDGRLLMANGAARRMLARDIPVGATFDRHAHALGLHRPDGTPYEEAELPLTRALRGERVVRQEVIIRRADGRDLPVMVNGSAVDVGGRRTAIAVFQDVSAIKEASRVREEFVHLISHDLRNPLGVIMGHAQWLHRIAEQRGVPDERRHADAVAKSAAQMHALLQDLVDSTRLESGQLSLRTQRLHLPSLVADVAERTGRAEDRSRIAVSAEEGVPPALIDPERFERVVVNLLTNALKYSGPTAPVTVTIAAVAGEVRLSVADRGIGIAREDLPHLFERFYRVRSAIRPEGLGLGLYITRLIVDAHDGRIWCESRLGEGSTFHVALPAADSRT